MTAIAACRTCGTEPLEIVIVADKTGRFRLPPMVRVYVEMKPRDVAA